MLEFILIATLHMGSKNETFHIPFNTKDECIQTAKSIAKTTTELEDLRCIVKRK